jgi:hypothetical protein
VVVSWEPPPPTTTPGTVRVSLRSRGSNQMTDGLRSVVVPARATRVPLGRRASSGCTLVARPKRRAISSALAAPLPASTGATTTRTSRLSISSPATPNTVPISKVRGSKPRPRQVSTAAATPVLSSGASVATTVHSRISAGVVASALTTHSRSPSTTVVLPPAPSGRASTPPAARMRTSRCPFMISTVMSGRPASVKWNRFEYRRRSRSSAEVSSARADVAVATKTARTEASKVERARMGRG